MTESDDTGEFVPVVEVRCGAKGCRKLLDVIGGPESHGRGAVKQAFPPVGHPYWSDPARVAWVESCRKHGGVPATLDELNQQRAARGLADMDLDRLGHAIPWRDLLAAYRESVAKRRRVVFVVTPRARSL